jgi:hypothetical protein
MKLEVTQAIEELKRKFPGSPVTVTSDGNGGARVILDEVQIGPRFMPERTWLGAHIPALYPYADIYPVFMGANVVRADGVQFQAPITPNANFEGRPALQISRRNNLAQQYPQPAYTKFLKVLDFLQKQP